jgi:Putative prokaryotic signal transducing protein/Putative bacterial sensory transduction regulator
MNSHDLVVVHSYSSQAEADLVKGVLESAGVPAMTTADTAGRMREHLAWSGAGFQVLVREEDAADARALLTEAEVAGAEEDTGNVADDSFPLWKRFT